MKNLLITIIEPIVNHPESVEIDVVESDSKIVFKIHVHEEDVGKVIGKGGRFIQAVRTIMTSANHNSSKRVFVEI